jgi:hypothetical protein
MTVATAERAPSRVRRNLLVVLACTALLLVLAIAGLKLTVDFVNDTSDVVPTQERTEIESADCAGLARLEARYVPNADSVAGPARAMRLVRERQSELRCSAKS